MKSSNKNLTLKEKVSAALIELNKQITTADRQAIITERNFTQAHLSNYMNGRGADLDTATEVMVFMKERVAAREKLIEAHL